MNYCEKLKTTLAIIIVALISWPLQAQLAEVVSLREIKLKEDAHPVIFQNMMKITSEEMEKKAMGARVSLWMGDRGARKGEYIHVYTFMFKETRDYYFPSEDGDAPRAEALDKRMNVPINPGTMIEADGYTDYVLLGFDEMVAPRGGPVVSLHPMEVAEGKEAAFEEMVVKDILPFWQENVEGMWVYFYKGERGKNKGKYIQVLAFDSVKRRNEYFPVEDKGGSDAFNKAIEGMPDFNGKMKEMGVKNVGKYSDYVIML